MRGTTCILTILAVIICSISFHLTAELVQEEYGRTTANMSSNDTDHQRIRRSTPTIVMPTRRIDGYFVTVTEGSDVKFSCSPYVKNCPYCGRPAQASKTKFEYAQVYFCRDPCKWGDVKAYERPVSYGTDRRFGVAKNSNRGHKWAEMTVTITGVRATDQGKYYCGRDKTGTEWYEAFDIVVNQPVPEPVRPLIEPALEPATKEEMAWMGEGEAGKGGVNSEVRRPESHGNVPGEQSVHSGSVAEGGAEGEHELLAVSANVSLLESGPIDCCKCNRNQMFDPTTDD